MNLFRSDSRRSLQPQPLLSAFTLIELMVVLAICGILAGMILPQIGRVTQKAQGVQCLNNTRQLTLGWLMYADDQEGRLCPNGSGPRQGWIEGVMNFDYNFTDNTNLVYLTDPQYAKLAPYAGNPGLYHCPADKSLAHVDHKIYTRVRSLAMNDAVGSNADGGFLPASRGWRTYHKITDVTAPAPVNLWLLLEQHPDSINDGRFMVDCDLQAGTTRLIDFPAYFHNSAASVSFADGHSEMHRWLDVRTMPANRYCGCLSHYAAEGYFVDCPNNVDVGWLQERTSARRN